MPLIKFDAPKDDHCTADSWTVAVYRLGMEYLGPEEGGRWFTFRELVAVATADTDAAATALALELEAGEYADRGRPLHSVNFGRGGDVAYSMYIHAPGDPIPYNNHADRPDHYE
jgi:hypothetical protein